MTQHNNNFNFIRLAAAFFVVFSHSFYVVGYPDLEPVKLLVKGRFELSGIGVCAFFFISGYFVTKSAYESKNVFLFLKKRFLRIYPALCILVLLTVFLLGPVFTQLPINNYFNHADTWKYLYTMSGVRIRMFLPGVFTESGYSEKGINASLWTIALEVELYLSLAFFIVIGCINNKSKKIFSYISGGIIMVCILILAIYKNLPFFYERQFGLISIFYTGALIATVAIKKNLVLTLFFLSLILYIFFQIFDPVYFKPNFFILFIISLGTYIIGYSKIIRIQLNNDISYGMYIYAFPIQQILFKLTNYNKTVLLQLILTLIILVPISLLSWIYVEKPCIALKYKKVLWKKI